MSSNSFQSAKNGSGFRIGEVLFDAPTFMAPMEGITDIPFRKIVRKHGCGVTCTQMIHAEGLLRGNGQRLMETMAMDPTEQPVGFQLCGPKPDIIAEAAKKVEQMGAAFVDLNMGCPAKNVVKIGAGAALLKEPARLAAVVRSTVNAVRIPVTVKIRAGWDDQYKNALEVAGIIEEEGAALLAAHARTRAQKFKGHADWNLIAELKKRVRIPVVGNGDVFDHSDIEEMQRTTGADGVMVARGALGNPWIFSGTNPDPQKILETLLEHLDLHLSFYGEKERSLVTFRKHIVWYTKKLRNASEFRLRVFKEKSVDRMVREIRGFFAQTEIEGTRNSNGI